MTQFFVYALKSIKDGRLYIGISADPYRRLAEHNAGMTRSTKSRRPFEIIHIEEFSDRKSARKKEIYLKSGCGREFLKKLIPL